MFNFPLNNGVSSEQGATGYLLRSVDYGDDNFTIFHSAEDNTLTVAKGITSEKVVLLITCKDPEQAGKLALLLSKENQNPFLQFQQFVWETWEGCTAKIITKFGEVDFSFDGNILKVPASHKLIFEPSRFLDPGTGLPLKAGVIKAADDLVNLENSVFTVGMLDIANLGAVNKVCGEHFANRLFKQFAEIASNNKLQLFRYGGDEFAFISVSPDESINKKRIENFINQVKGERMLLLEQLSYEVRTQLEETCLNQQLKKGREHKADPLDLYVGGISVTSEEFSALCDIKNMTPGMAIQRLVGQSEVIIYELKNSPNRILYKPFSLSRPPREADIQYVKNAEKLDDMALKMKDSILDPNLSHIERFALFLDLIVICCEDVAVNNGTCRGERVGPHWEILSQGMKSPSSIVIDIPAGILNDNFGPDRTDKIFEELFSGLVVDGSCLSIRESGGGFKFIFAIHRPSLKDLEAIEDEVGRRLGKLVDANVHKSGKYEDVPAKFTVTQSD